MVKAADRAKNPARSSVWLENRAARSGGGPAGLDRERIVAASIRMLDEEGLAKLSMRRLATELNVTAMSLYWYVDTKDDILEYAIDTVYGEMDLVAVEGPAAGGTGSGRSRSSTGGCSCATRGCRRSRASTSTSARTRSPPG
ncbi:TetR/AcrR family transcriptional regulator [Streptomyces sp. SBR177]